VHLAAESHVDRSIGAPADFVRTNVVGTFELLEAVRAHLPRLTASEQQAFRFLHVSTDEVYGDLDADARPADERARYAPSSPYAASKAAADHLVRAAHRTYGLPVLLTASGNNYGPFQHPEKLIPRMIVNAIAGAALPVYGDGMQSRDWIHVADHCAALRLVLARGRIGETYHVSGANERRNIDVVRAICCELDRRLPRVQGSYSALITSVADRPGHDRRYALDAGKLRAQLGWSPARDFAQGLRDTVGWYLDHPQWIAAAAPAAGAALDRSAAAAQQVQA
jgi:dTDP-glucose 4,6-dehydratase